MENFYEMLLKYLFQMFSVYIGAFFAFSYNIKLKEREERNKLIKEINKVQMLLIKQLNTLLSFEREIKEVEKNNEKLPLWIKLRAILPTKGLSIDVDLSYLDFLYTKQDIPGLIFQVNLRVEGLDGIIKLIEIRSKVHMDRFQPAFEKLPKNIEDMESIKEFLGEKLVGELEGYTQDICNNIKEEIIMHKNLIKEINKHSTLIYKKAKILSLP